MTPDLEVLLADINKAAHAAGTNAWVRDVLQRSHRAIRDLREMSAINESGCERALEMLEISAATCKALTAEVDRRREERIELDRRIHNQRASLRQTWEIVEQRRNYMGSPASRAAYARLLKRHQKLLADQQRIGPEFEKVLMENLNELYIR